MYFYNLNTRDKNNKEGEDVTEEDNGRSGVNNCYDVIINTTPSTTIITMSGLCLVLCLDYEIFLLWEIDGAPKNPIIFFRKSKYLYKYANVFC